MKSDLQKMIESLEQKRDLFKVKLHLANAEARDEWEKIEKNWDRLQSKLKQAKREANEVSQELETGVQLLVDEIKRGYDRIKRIF